MTATQHEPGRTGRDSDAPASTTPRRRWGRPTLYTSYGQEMALLNTRAKQLGVLAIIAVAAYLPLTLEDDLLALLGTGLVLAIGAIGLNLLTGAYTAAVLAGDPDGRYLGFGVSEAPVWIVAAGVVAALFGVVVAPLATRLRGLYLAVVTLGLVFIGQYFFAEWREMSGGPGIGRESAVPVVLGNDLTRDGAYTEEQKLFWLFLVVLVIMAVLGRNIARSRIGRAFAAVRDRDIAAGVMGVELGRYKLIAFTISSFFAGVCGSLLYAASGQFSPEQFGLLLSVQFIAMVLIGGVATISGSIMGALLISMLPRLSSELPGFLPFVSSSPTDHPNVFEVEVGLYGALIVAFLLFEPRGLYGIWLRIRTYWKSFPFSY